MMNQMNKMEVDRRMRPKVPRMTSMEVYWLVKLASRHGRTDWAVKLVMVMLENVIREQTYS